MIFALSPFGHIDHAMAPAHVPINAAVLGSRCLGPAKLQQQIGKSLGMVAIVVAAGDDLQLVVVELFRPMQQVAAVLQSQVVPIRASKLAVWQRLSSPITVLAI